MFEEVNNYLIGKEAVINNENYEFLCFYMYHDDVSDKSYIKVMLIHKKSKLVNEFVFSNDLNLRIM
jgi:hypothetical protein